MDLSIVFPMFWGREKKEVVKDGDYFYDHPTALEGCQCRKARIVRNHVACAILVWVRLKQVAHETNRTVYHLKHGLLSDYLRHQLKSPAIQMTFA